MQFNARVDGDLYIAIECPCYIYQCYETWQRSWILLRCLWNEYSEVNMPRACHYSETRQTHPRLTSLSLGWKMWMPHTESLKKHWNGGVWMKKESGNSTKATLMADNSTLFDFHYHFILDSWAIWISNNQLECDWMMIYLRICLC